MVSNDQLHKSERIDCRIEYRPLGGNYVPRIVWQRDKNQNYLDLWQQYFNYDKNIGTNRIMHPDGAITYHFTSRLESGIYNIHDTVFFIFFN